jgi:salicylate hydroxylase
MGFSEQRIAIIGGGLGGMSFINAALHVGLTNVELYERAAEFNEVGAGISITRNANSILDSYGLKESMLKRSTYDLPCYMEYRNYRTGQYLGQVEESAKPSSRLLHRAHLLETLKERVPDSKLHLDKRLTGITRTNNDEAYRLHFQDGTHTDADTVVGCDGIKSAVREYLNITDDPDYSGQVVYRGFVEYHDLPSDTAQLLRGTTNFRGPQRHILVIPIGNDESHTTKAAVIGFMTESLESWTSENWMSRSEINRLHEHVKDWCPAVQDIIAALRKSSPDGKMMKQALYVRKPLEKWYEMNEGNAASGIILLGDSAHSTLPHQGNPPSLSYFYFCNLTFFVTRPRLMHGH